ncbi:MAG: glutamate synthase subunit beta [Candidatus Omnitrophota bacterium]
MGDIRGFIKIKRAQVTYRPVCERIKDYKEVFVLRPETTSQEQGSRCMDCGTPFCHWACPVGNYIPEWNDAVFRKNWEKAFNLLSATNPLPEITGRVCPALCEYSCVLGINDEAITIRENELSVVEHAFKNNLIKAHPPKIRTKKKVAVIGSGPAGLSVATTLNKFGHNVVVFEKDDKVGGILRYGIPDFKLEKYVLDRRIKIYEREGIKFVTNTNVGADYSVKKLLKEFDAVCLAGGSRVPRDFPPKADPPQAENIEDRNLDGIHFAMDYLIQSNKRVRGIKFSADKLIDAKGKRVVVIGGGDTGADCVGTANRQGASCVVQIEIMPKPPECRTENFPWPKYPLILKTSTSHEEGAERKWSILTKKFVGDKQVRAILCVRVDSAMKEIKGSEFEIEADLVILALGFIGPEYNGLIKEIETHCNASLLDARGNVKTDSNYQTSVKKVFSAGDMHRGQSLVVWAIYEGIEAAKNINKFLRG